MSLWHLLALPLLSSRGGDAVWRTWPLWRMAIKSPPSPVENEENDPLLRLDNTNPWKSWNIRGPTCRAKPLKVRHVAQQREFSPDQGRRSKIKLIFFGSRTLILSRFCSSKITTPALKSKIKDDPDDVIMLCCGGSRSPNGLTLRFIFSPECRMKYIDLDLDLDLTLTESTSFSVETWEHFLRPFDHKQGKPADAVDQTKTILKPGARCRSAQFEKSYFLQEISTFWSLHTPCK